MAIDFSQGAGLNRIAQGGSRAVGFNIGDLCRVDVCVCTSCLQTAALSRWAWRAQAIGLTILRQTRTTDHSINSVLINLGLGQGFEHYQPSPFPAHHAVGGGIKGFTFSIRGQGLGLFKALLKQGGEQNIYATHQGHFSLAISQALQGQMQSCECRRTGGVNHQTGAVKIKEIREPVGNHAGGGTRNGVHIDLIQALQLGVGIVHTRYPNKHPYLFSAQVFTGLARIKQGLNPQFQHQALLQIHARGFSGRHTKIFRIKTTQFRQLACKMGALQFKALRGNGFDGMGARAQQFPESLRAFSARKTAGHANNCDRGVRHFCSRRPPVGITTV